MRFLLDMNMPPSFAERLHAQGHEAVHALDAGLADRPDQQLFERATAENRIVVTFDLDFGEIAGAVTGNTCGVILLRLKLARPAYLWTRLQVAIAEAAEALQGGAIVVVEDSRIRIRRMLSEID